MKTVRIAQVDMWEGCPLSYVKRFIPSDYEFVVDEVNPQIVFYSCFGLEHLKYDKAIKIFINGESFFPDFNDCDYCIGTVKNDFMGRSFWIPLSHWFSVASPQVPEISRETALNRKFCSFIYSQDSFGSGARERKELCLKLMKYKPIECPGKVLHNCDPELLSDRMASDWVESKRKYCSGFKFSIAYENCNMPGYITEKLIDCYLSNTVPIYCGSLGEVAPYPKESMICVDDFASFDELIERIKEIDQDDDAYMAILNANPFRNNGMKDCFTQGAQEFVGRIIESGSPLFDNVRVLSAAYYCQLFIQAEKDPWFRVCRRIIGGLRSLKNRLRRLFKHK